MLTSHVLVTDTVDQSRPGQIQGSGRSIINKQRGKLLAPRENRPAARDPGDVVIVAEEEVCRHRDQ